MPSLHRDDEADVENESADFCHSPDMEPIPGYRLLVPLGRGGFGEVWKCEAPGGLLKAIKFVSGGLHALDDNAPAEEELRAIQRVKAIRHPFLLSIERVERISNELIIVMELADRNLGDLLRAEREAGRTGIPRERLIGYMREAAEALDVLNDQHGLQHLDIKPQNLFLFSNHIKIGDFGLVSSLKAPGGQGLAAITPTYASPEVFKGSLSSHSDQYSLAIVYQELLTGQRPFVAKNARMLMLMHCQEQPILDSLPVCDRAIVARALAKNPPDRFASCTEFVNALSFGMTEVVAPLTEIQPEAATTSRKVVKRSVDPTRPMIPACLDGPLEIGELVSRSPLSDVWRASLADGSQRMVSVLYGCAGPGDPNIALLSSLRHEHIEPVEVLLHVPGQIVLCRQTSERTLRDESQAYRAMGMVGIPRRELLYQLRLVAETLDYFAQHRGIQHLALNPRSIELSQHSVRIVHFGLAQLVWLPANQDVAQLNARYAAPELLERRISSTCDQYSLALIYHELLTGEYPTFAKPVRRGEPPTLSLDRLSPTDQVLVGRALHPDPSKRWESLIDLIRALEAASAEAEEPVQNQGGFGASMIGPLRTPSQGPRVLDPAMHMRFGTSLSSDLIKQRLEGFRNQWQAKTLTDESACLVYQMSTPQNFWQRWTTRQPGLEIAFTIGQPDIAVPSGVQTSVVVQLHLEARNCAFEEGREMLRRVGPLLADSVRQHLQIGSGVRKQQRVAWHHPFQLWPILSNRDIGEPIDCQGKDISLNGIGFYVQKPLPTAEVLIALPKTPQTPSETVMAQIVRVQRFVEGWFEVGAVLPPPDELPPDEELE